MLCFRILWTTGVNTSMTTMDRGRSLQCWGDGSTWSGTGLVGSGGAPASPDRGVRGRWGPALLPGAPGALTTMCRGGGGPALLPRAPGSPDRGVRERRGPALLPGAPGALTTMCGGGGGPALLPGAPGSPDHHVRRRREPSSAAQAPCSTLLCGFLFPLGRGRRVGGDGTSCLLSVLSDSLRLLPVVQTILFNRTVLSHSPV